jgi:hypothetical protein
VYSGGKESMKKEFEDAIFSGEIVKVQNFTTDKGDYRIVIVRDGLEFFFYKYKNRELVECSNLNKLEAIKID